MKLFVSIYFIFLCNFRFAFFIILVYVISDVMDCIIGLQERIDILRRGFDILRRENIVLRRQLEESDAENRRLTNVMMNFEF